MATKGYTTETEIEDYLLINIDGTFSARVQKWIAAIERYIERYTGRVFLADTVATQKVFSADGSGVLIIPDAVEITEVLVDDEVVVEDDLENAGYKITTGYNDAINSIAYSGLYKGYKNVKVTAKWGTFVEVPEDINFAATVLVAGIINNGANSGGEVQSETIGRYTVTYKTAQQKVDIDTAKEILRSYKSYKFI